MNHAIKGESALQYNAKSLSDTNIWVRIFIEESPEIIRNEESISYLVPCLKDSDNNAGF